MAEIGIIMSKAIHGTSFDVTCNGVLLSGVLRSDSWPLNKKGNGICVGGSLTLKDCVMRRCDLIIFVCLQICKRNSREPADSSNS